jgi:hypothetical protein
MLMWLNGVEVAAKITSVYARRIKYVQGARH